MRFQSSYLRSPSVVTTTDRNRIEAAPFVSFAITLWHENHEPGLRSIEYQVCCHGTRLFGTFWHHKNDITLVGRQQMAYEIRFPLHCARWRGVHGQLVLSKYLKLMSESCSTPNRYGTITIGVIWGALCGLEPWKPSAGSTLPHYQGAAYPVIYETSLPPER